MYTNVGQCVAYEIRSARSYSRLRNERLQCATELFGIIKIERRTSTADMSCEGREFNDNNIIFLALKRAGAKAHLISGCG